MGTAILSGLIKAGFEPSSIAVSTRTAQSAAKLAQRFGVEALATETTADANSIAASGADVVIAAVKPMYITSVLQEVAAVLPANSLVISVAAGVTTQAMESVLPSGVGVVRSMPNTPAIVGSAVTGISAGNSASPQQVAQAVSLFETVGKVVVLDENQIDQLSSISGSGPAYVFYLIEQFTNAAIAQGFKESTAQLLVSETFLGATKLLAASQNTPAELRRQVTSPNGTTERAIAVFEQWDFAKIFKDATDAAIKRSKEIAAGK